jgi:hypothetical protein
MNRNLDVVRFAHPALLGRGGDEGGDGGGEGAVSVFQNLDTIAAGDDATARWVWPGATATAQWQGCHSTPGGCQDWLPGDPHRLSSN